MRIISERDEAAVMASLFSPDQLETRFAGGTNDYMFDPDAYLDATYPDHLLLNQQQKHQQLNPPIGATGAAAAVKARELVEGAPLEAPTRETHARSAGGDEPESPLIRSTSGQVPRAEPSTPPASTYAKAPPSANGQKKTAKKTRASAGDTVGDLSTRLPSNNEPGLSEECLDEVALKGAEKHSS